jgi:putative ABC transport system permease protein
VEEAIRRQLGTKYRLHIRTTEQLFDYFANQARQTFSVLYSVEIITFALVLVGIGDTLGTGVLERTREIGIMRAVGLSVAISFRW